MCVTYTWMAREARSYPDTPGTAPTVDEYRWISEMSALAKSTGNQLVWGEGSSASCGGVDGISNVFGSGLWALDALLEFAWRGVTLSILSGTPQATCRWSFSVCSLPPPLF